MFFWYCFFSNPGKKGVCVERKAKIRALLALTTLFGIAAYYTAVACERRGVFGLLEFPAALLIEGIFFGCAAELLGGPLATLFVDTWNYTFHVLRSLKGFLVNTWESISRVCQRK
ncbi:MAG: hypothetical protein WCW16_04555 [Candidatus Magasanikbacteria bacterium]